MAAPDFEPKAPIFGHGKQQFVGVRFEALPDILGHIDVNVVISQVDKGLWLGWLSRQT